jgi:hypothetical protein
VALFAGVGGDRVGVGARGRENRLWLMWRRGERRIMATAKLRTGEMVEMPFEEMLTFVAQNPDLIQEQHSEVPMPKRRSMMAEDAATSR